MTFREHYTATRDLVKARRAYLRERHWTPEDWYLAWQTTDLPNEVVDALR